MKKLLFSTLFFYCFTTLLYSQVTNQYQIIPQPTQVIPQTGRFRLSATTLIVVPFMNEELKKIAETLALQIKTASGLNIQLRNVNKMALPAGNHIFFMPSPDEKLGREGYRIEILPTKLTLEAKQTNGFFYGVQSILQLLPPEVFSSQKTVADWSVPCGSITDIPRYTYRGLHLDVGRHFFPVSFVKRYIDLMSVHKFNTFHWHLTEDQGWRIEIKKYPKLTEIGSKRKETLVGHYGSNEYDNTPYGGFYTQDEIREVVKYAQSKYITIVPEIEMPGHALAALASYPEFSCDPSKKYEVGTTWGVYDDIFCPSEQTFSFLEDVLTEVIGLFPGTYVHIGGDEAPKDVWKKSKFCQDLIKKEKLKDEHELQSYFIKRIDKFLTSKGKKMIGWDETLEGGISPNATIMSWRGIEGGIAAARQKHDAIMTPTGSVYFDYYQADPATEPLAIGGFLPVNKVYDYDPTPVDSLSDEEQKHIIGVQANLWTEYIATTSQVEYMVYPRALALSEVAWSEKKNKNWNSFVQRMKTHMRRLDFLKVNYARSYFNPQINVTVAESGNLVMTLSAEDKESQIRYTLDGKEPSALSASYQVPVIISKTTTVKAAAFKNGKQLSKVIGKDFFINKATGKPYTLINAPHQYTGTTKAALTDGIRAVPKTMDFAQWVGFLGNDLEMVLDLKQVTEVNQIMAGYAVSHSSWIFAPTQAEVSVSEDGKTFVDAKVIKIDSQIKLGIESVTIPMEKVQTRFIKIKLKNAAVGPQGSGAPEGKPVFLFVDEISVD
jgi:hexosaminidase